ncbi:MAG TPA: FAD-dependent oxidoreductase, partial [Saprospiraceae bacterium]|nr:FAD-dependent oxidoreductase [Saprospiraceae bacterium]
LIIATGAVTNYFNNQKLSSKVIPMKSVSEALYLRNKILEDYENAVTSSSTAMAELLTDVVIVGGGPTGVELAGSLAEMRNDILPREFKEIKAKEIEIYLIHGGDHLLQGMDIRSGLKAEQYLTQMGVKVIKNTFVKEFDGTTVITDTGMSISTNKVIWAAGITGDPPKGISTEFIGPGNRLLIDSHCKVKSTGNVYAVGDAALLIDDKNPKGYPQVAQVAIQQGKLIARNLIAVHNNKALTAFRYRDLGTMATIGRYRAVVDLPFIHFTGYFAWLTWLFVHLVALIGLRNKIIVTINWFWSYIRYGQSLRLIIKPRIVSQEDIAKDV